MRQIAKDFKDKGVDFYMLYTREPHEGEVHYKRKRVKDPETGRMKREYELDGNGEKIITYDFSKKRETATHQERVDYALEMMKEYNQFRPVIIDRFKDTLQKSLGGGAPNSLALIDKDGKIVLWQQWSHPKKLREHLEDMTAKDTN